MGSSAATRHRHEALGLALTAPAGWDLLEESEHGLVLELLSETRRIGARVAVMVEPVEPGADLAAVTTRVLASRARAGAAMRLIDRQTQRLGAATAERVVLHREGRERAETVEEWRLLAEGGRLVTISAVCATAAYDRHADDFARLARGVRVDVPEQSSGTPGPLFDPGAGLLIVTDAAFDALRTLAATGSPDTEAAEDLAALVVSGAIVDGQPHPALVWPLAVTTNPLFALSLTRGHATVRAWADAADASLLLPVGTQGWRQLVHGRADLLPETLAGLVGLGPVGAPAKRETVTLPVGALARAIASATPDEARSALVGLRKHWRIEAHRRGAAGGEMLEVLESESGLWLAVGHGESVELRPTDAASVWRHLSQFTPAGA